MITIIMIIIMYSVLMYMIIINQVNFLHSIYTCTYNTTSTIIQLHSLSEVSAQTWPILVTLHVQVIYMILHAVWTIVCTLLHTGCVQKCTNLFGPD